MKKVLIIEDDLFSAKHLHKLIMDIDDTIDIYGPLRSVADVVDTLSDKNDFDLIFSDIRLADGEVFEAFRTISPNSFIIFITAYDDYAMPAIKNNGLDYLMKPVDPKELCAAVNKLKFLKSSQGVNIRHQLNGLLNDTHRYRERFLINKSDELKILYADEINYISKEDGNVLAFTDDAKPYILPMTMSELETELDPKKFFRINRQYIANVKAIKKINVFFSSKLIIRLKGCPDNNIIISKEKTALLKKWLDR